MKTSNYMSLHDVASIKISEIKLKDLDNEKYAVREIKIILETGSHKHRLELTMYADDPGSLKIKKGK